MSSSSTQASVPLVLPTVFLRFWSDGAPKDRDAALEPLLSLPGVHRVGVGLLALLPIAGDPAEVELGLTLARQAYARAAVGILVFPGHVQVGLEGVEALPDSVLRSLDSGELKLAPGRIYLTGYAAGRLRGEWPLERVQVPLPSLRVLALGGPGLNFRPWHNPRLLLRITEHVPRPDVEQALLSHRDAPILRVKGAIGVGKSRLVWNALGPGCTLEPAMAAQGLTAWISLPGPRFGSPSPAHLVLRQLARALGRKNGEGLEGGLSRLGLESHESWILGREGPPEEEVARSLAAGAVATAKGIARGPVRLVFDDLQAAGQPQMEQLSRLFQALPLEDACRLVLINRLGHSWPKGTSGAPQVPVPPMTSYQLASLSTGLCEGLSLPEAVEERLREASGGVPLAFEEALIKMIHAKHLRQIYGSFFFSGDETAGYRPSPRWIQLLESEGRSLGRLDGLRVLAAAGIPVPASELSAATSLLGVSLPPGWDEPFAAAGWLSRTTSEWGPGLDLTCPAYRDGLAATVNPTATPILRRTVGEILSHASDRPQARWQAYNLLSGTEAAVPPILELAQGAALGPGAGKILEGLGRELQAHRRRGGDPGTEIQLLWTLLPLARRLGRLEEFGAELDRALEVSAAEPRKLLAFASLKTDLDLKKGRLKDGEKTLRSALELVVEEDPGRQALLLLQLARLLVRQNRFEEARSLLEQLLPVLQERQATAQIASCKFHLGNIALHQGRLDDAFALHSQGLEQRRQEGNHRTLGSSLSALGAVAIAQGDYGKALQFYNEAERVLEEHGEAGEVSFALLGRGRVLRRLGDFAAAGRDLRMALTLRDNKSDRVGEALPRLLLATNQIDLGRPQEALTEARLASFELRLGPEVVQLAEAEQLLGRIHLQLKQPGRARSHLDAALDVHRRHGDTNGALVDLSWMLRLAMAEGKSAELVEICCQIEEGRSELKPSERREILDFRLYESYRWLDQQGIPHGGDGRQALERAFEELVRKAGLLDADLRHRFLFQVPENAAILEAASARHLEMPNFSSGAPGRSAEAAREPR